ncbi:MAG TPA: hypothetical protein VKD90_20600 [Gemmataceae bacterium]|nr:hypothetical protein [Gemmataceae bacterium]
MDRYARIVFGYHGTDPAFAERLVRGEIAPADWSPSENKYDWLGHGIYFWEYAPDRARAWTRKGGVVGAIITLGVCLDLTDVKYTHMLTEAYTGFAARQRRRRKPLPENRGKRRDLDCAVINYLVEETARRTGVAFQTVRAPFLEGDPIYPGSAILSESHVQVAVRDPLCIIGVFRAT